MMPRLQLCAPVLLLVTLSLPAQDDWEWPDSTENLQVLPAHWSGERLRPVMIGFTNALGVRCSYCHVGEEGEPLSTYDFVADDNPNKDRARAMLNMLGDINDHLDKIERSGAVRVNMWCHTCHRGRPRPMTIAEELGEVYALSGAAAAEAHYDSLRSRYYGRGAYNFDQNALNDFGYQLLGKKDTAAAIRFFTRNAQLYPLSSNVWDSLAEAYMTAGDLTNAIAYYEKAIAFDPYNQNAVDMIQKMKNERQRLNRHNREPEIK